MQLLVGILFRNELSENFLRYDRSLCIWIIDKCILEKSMDFLRLLFPIILERLDLFEVCSIFFVVK